MKILIKTLVLASTLIASSQLYAQFYDKTGEVVTECDCAKQLNQLDMDVVLPDNYTKYDYIQFVLYKDGANLSSFVFAPRELEGKVKRFNILNPNSKGMRSIFGGEYGLYRGTDFYLASYNSLCEGNGEVRLKAKAFGITQVGTNFETEYYASGDRIKAKTTAIPVYDDGVEISETEELTIRQDKFTELTEYQRKGQLGLAIVGGTAIIGYIAFLVLASVGN